MDLFFHKATEAVAGNIQSSFKYSCTGSNQYQEDLHCNQDGHGIPGMLNDRKDDAAEDDEHQSAKDERRDFHPYVQQKDSYAEMGKVCVVI